MRDLPIISMRILDGPDCSARRDELEKLRYAARHIGFFCVRDCEDDVPPALVERTFAMSKALFALPRASLERIRLNRKTDRSNRGWEGLAEQALNANTEKGKEDLNFSYRWTDDFGPERSQRLTRESGRRAWLRVLARREWAYGGGVSCFR